MPTNFTNRRDAQSLKGQGVLVTLNSSDAANLYLVQEGMLCTNGTSNKTGTVSKVNVYGNSFLVDPIQPDRNFDSAPTVYGYLSTGTVVTVNT